MDDPTFWHLLYSICIIPILVLEAGSRTVHGWDQHGHTPKLDNWGLGLRVRSESPGT